MNLIEKATITKPIASRVYILTTNVVKNDHFRWNIPIAKTKILNDDPLVIVCRCGTMPIL